MPGLSQGIWQEKALCISWGAYDPLHDLTVYTYIRVDIYIWVFTVVLKCLYTVAWIVYCSGTVQYITTRLSFQMGCLEELTLGMVQTHHILDTFSTHSRLDALLLRQLSWTYIQSQAKHLSTRPLVVPYDTCASFLFGLSHKTFYSLHMPCTANSLTLFH